MDPAGNNLMYLSRQTKRPPAFTLVELMVVITIMSVAVGTVVLRFDGFTDRSRLESTAAQFFSLLQLASTQAQTTGEPRLIEYPLGTSGVRIRKPRLTNETWEWDEGLEFALATGVTVERMVIEGDAPASSGRTAAIRVRSDGRFPRHAVILGLHGTFAVVLVDSRGEPQFHLLDRRPQSGTWDLLLLELTSAGIKR